MSRPPLFFIIVVVAIALLATQRFVQQRRQHAANDAAPPQSLRATLTEKRALPSPLRSRQREEIVAETVRYSLQFTPLGGGEPRRFTLPERDCATLTPGMRGTLRVQGTRFVAFSPDAA
ncbi:DUF2500 domain-containing protein [Edwardsiella piscicida]|uniref:DUF2500 domain-containing protein n=3 Tax=Edwardsiella TaxID=635 RepID=A0AAQ3H4P1_EDWPI|nr:DUF2500 domain-containing protein [Edwardsiella piscicida]ACY86163.1 hypothetical protein ETAE_3332 [Edwardsiella tarda EIB202]ADM43122.1 Putative receptor [Edwardsiella tarda FL6-60]AGH75302.1 Putative receptor [Edwardsiella piscicida C07-087]ARD18475.1 hypothetical protein BXA22_09085 [Edwardsiella piscicida]EKS7781393.1 DUF2500 domain-containing protein [Edwardsiella piscicida]